LWQTLIYTSSSFPPSSNNYVISFTIGNLFLHLPCHRYSILSIPFLPYTLLPLLPSSFFPSPSFLSFSPSLFKTMMALSTLFTHVIGVWEAPIPEKSLPEYFYTKCVKKKFITSLTILSLRTPHHSHIVHL
jgi:hypothetical protein